MDIESYLRQAQEGDVVGTTDLSVLSAAIKNETWRHHVRKRWYRVNFDQKLSSHIAVTVRGLDGRWWFAEMLSTRKQVRYVSVAEHLIITRDEYEILRDSEKARYQKMTTRSGLVLSDPMKYNHKAPRRHVCWVGRHPLLANQTTRSICNELVFRAHRVGRGYDNGEILDFPRWLDWMGIDGREDRLICSELPREMFDAAGVDRPDIWSALCSPMSHQIWGGYETVFGA